MFKETVSSIFTISWYFWAWIRFVWCEGIYRWWLRDLPGSPFNNKMDISAAETSAYPALWTRERTSVWNKELTQEVAAWVFCFIFLPTPLSVSPCLFFVLLRPHYHLTSPLCCRHIPVKVAIATVPMLIPTCTTVPMALHVISHMLWCELELSGALWVNWRPAGHIGPALAFYVPPQKSL